MCRPYGWVFGSKVVYTRVPCSADFPKTWVGFPEIGKKLSKMDSCPSKLTIKVGMMATVGN